MVAGVGTVDAIRTPAEAGRAAYLRPTGDPRADVLDLLDRFGPAYLAAIVAEAGRLLVEVSR